MAYLSVTSPEFQEACKQWLNELGEVLVLFRYSHAAGSKDYEFFTDISLLNDRIS